MSAFTEPRIRLNEPTDLIAAVPHLLGFHPENSLVLIAHRRPSDRDDSGSVIGFTTRTDLPAPARVDALTEHLATVIGRQEPCGVTLLLVSDREVCGDGRPPGAELIEAVRAAFAGAGIPVADMLWARTTRKAAPWRSYRARAGIGGNRGTVADPQSSRLAAASAMAGFVTYGTRDELVRMLDGAGSEVLARRASLLERACDEAMAGERPSASEGVAAVRAAIADPEGFSAGLDDASVVRLVAALTDHRVRDACLLQDGPAAEEAAGRLWLELTRATPEPERAEPACLLACSAFVRGDGALASAALEKAAAADPGHTLTDLVRTAVQAAIPPWTLRDCLLRAVQQARKLMSGEER